MATDTEQRRRQGLAVKARMAHERMKRMQAERDGAIREAVAAGVTMRQIGKVVGLSHQRIAQIVKGP
jgi:uncharacterized protein (DUF2062 family)